ncbi:MAG: hypothetical protein H6Q74_372 [Firmicutes bacterium]|nr:hypothetical protein [Bacillota bacterium]
MLPFPKTVKKRALLASVVLAAAFILAYCYVEFETSRDVPSKLTDVEVVGQDGKIKLAENCTLVQKIVYLKCGDEEEFRTKISESMVGLNLNQVQQIYAGWNINKFDAQEVIMTLEVDSFCRDHLSNMFLGVQDEKVAVFYGHPGPKAVLKEVINIPLSRLQEKDAEELRHGLVVGSKDELLRTLEGLQAQ